MEKYVEPAWLGSQAGISAKVLKPWTPVEFDHVGNNLNLGVWGRSYEFGPGGLFVAQVRANGCSLLTRPVNVQARVNGRKVEWDNASFQVTERSPGQVLFSTKSSGGSLRFSSVTTIEYDGMIRMDWRVEPEIALTLDELVFEIPLRAEHAKYLYTFYGRSHFTGAGSWELTNPGALPEDGYSADFRPFLWLGDNDTGFCWFCESDKNWYSNGSDQVIAIARDGDEVALRVHLVNTPLSLSPDGKSSHDEEMVHPKDRLANLMYTFGLQATPVKPVEKDVWDYRIFHVIHETFGVATRLRIPEEALDKLAAAGVKTVCFHEHWTDAEAYYDTPYGEDLKYLVDACHKRGIQLLLYFGYLISNLAPEWPSLGDEVVIKPIDKGSYFDAEWPPQPRQDAYMVCYNSIWQDAIAHGIAHLIDEYDIDGVYLDGTEYPWACHNRGHGCGYTSIDGTTRFTYPIFAVRNLLRRIATIVQERKPDGQVNIHNSTCMTIPTLGWATSYWDGEQFAAAEPDKSVFESMPLDAFRCEFMGHQWGVPAEFLSDPRGKFEYQNSYAFTLLHDVLIRTWVFDGPEMELESRLWRLSDEFGRKQAKWLPYWRNSDFATTSIPDAYCSLYVHETNGVLAVISNLNPSAASVRIGLNLGKLGFGGNVAAVDALSEERVDIENGAIDLDLQSLEWKVLWVKTAPAE